MPPQTVIKKIAVDRLGCRGALPGSDNHLAICRRHASGGIEARHTGVHKMVDLNLTLFIQFRPRGIIALVMWKRPGLLLALLFGLGTVVILRNVL